MGSSGSKAARVAGSAARQYPTRTPTTSSAPAQAATSPSSSPSSAPSATTNAPPQAPPPASNSQPGPTVKPSPHASGSRSEAINLDASDPDFAQSLRSLGPVQPNPTLSPSSAFGSQNDPNQSFRPSAPDPRKNPAIMVLSARSRLQDEAEVEFMEGGKRGHAGRQYLDVYTIRQILQMRDQRGQSDKEIERVLGLKDGVVERLGGKGVVGMAYDTGRAQQEINMV